MLKIVKPENLPVYVQKVEYIFPEFKMSSATDIADIQNYYAESYWGYALFHSWAGAIHMALSKGGTFSKGDYFRQAEEVGDVIEKEITTHPKVVLEVGCGRGFNLSYLAARFPEVNFIGCDISAVNVKSAKQRFKKIANVRIEEDDFNKLTTVTPGSVDVVFGVETLCHATSPDIVLKVISKVLRRGGKLIVFDGFRQIAVQKDDVTNRAVNYTERAMAVPEFRTVEAFIECASTANLRPREIEDRSSEIMPNLTRLSDLAKAFFKVPVISKLLLRVLPRGLVTNSVAGLLMAVTVQTGVHRYFKIILVKE